MQQSNGTTSYAKVVYYHHSPAGLQAGQAAVEAVAVRFGQKLLTVASSDQPDFEHWRKFAEDLAECWNRSEHVPVQPHRTHRPASNGLPSTAADAVAMAAHGGVPPEFAEMIFHQCNARGFVDACGLAIRDFRSFLQYQWNKQRSDWQGKEEVTRGRANTIFIKPASTWEIQQRLEAIEKEMQEINKKSSCLSGGVLSYGRYRDNEGVLLPKYKSYRDSLTEERNRLTTLLRGVARPD